MIPGNEVGINNMMNKLIYKGVDVIVPKGNNIHVSGHPAKDELTLMYSWIKPYRSIPVHGEAVHISAHAEIASDCGVKDILKIKNGSLVDITNDKGKVVNVLKNGKVALNGNELIPTDSRFFKERKRMLYNGVISINILISNTGDLLELPRIKMLAVLNLLDEASLLLLSEFLEDQLRPFIPIKKSRHNNVKDFIKKKMKRYLENNFNKSPSIILDIIYIED